MDIIGLGEKQQKILQLLMKEKEGMTVDQFSRHLGISKSAIHQHLTVLERDGFLRKAASLQTGGRPGTIFVLTNKGLHLFPKHYNLFATMLINLIKQKLGQQELVNLLKELGALIAETKKDLMLNKTIDEKLEITINIMEELGYEAQVAADKVDGSLAIEAFNCVFHDMAQSNSDVCELDLALLSSLLDREVEHTSCLVKGDCKCQFNISSRNHT